MSHDWVWPNGLKTMPPVNSPWGWRVHPVSGTRRFHYGTDFAHTFTYNCSITDGTVVAVGYVSGWYGGGYGIWVKNWDGSLAKYFHGVDGSALVRVGQKVRAGQHLSRVGRSGTATGVHCHLEISPNGGANSQVNPVPWLQDRIASTSGEVVERKAEVIAYHRQDTTARKSGRIVPPGEGFYLHRTEGLATSQADNIVGGIGAYSITVHVYAEGEPGDSVDVYLLWQDTKARPRTNSFHYTESIELGSDGKAKRSFEFKRAVQSGYAVYARLNGSKANKADVKVTVFDTDAYLFIA